MGPIKQLNNLAGFMGIFKNNPHLLITLLALGLNFLQLLIIFKLLEKLP